jgi:hypothetical protein
LNIDPNAFWLVNSCIRPVPKTGPVSVIVTTQGIALKVLEYVARYLSDVCPAHGVGYAPLLVKLSQYLGRLGAKTWSTRGAWGRPCQIPAIREDEPHSGGMVVLLGRQFKSKSRFPGPDAKYTYIAEHCETSGHRVLISAAWLIEAISLNRAFCCQ